jgi:hypothetical protein
VGLPESIDCLNHSIRVVQQQTQLVAGQAQMSLPPARAGPVFRELLRGG